MNTGGQTPNNPARLNALVALAQQEHRAGRLAEAAEAYCQILAVRPDVAEVHNDLGIVRVLEGKVDEAAACFRQAIALKENLAEAHFNLGNALFKLGHLREAVAPFQRSLVLRPDNADARNNLAIALRTQGRLGEAVTEFRQAIALRPDFAAAHNNLGDTLASLGQLDEAAASLERAIALSPDYAEAHSNLTRVLWLLGRLDEASRHVERALALRPDLPDAHNNQGIILAEQVRFDQARACFERAVALRPGYAEAYNRLGRVLVGQQQIEQAKACFEQALAIAPQYADAECSLATCHLLEGDYERGWPRYEARLRLRPIEPQRAIPRYAGEPLVGRRLLLIAEQGLGDTIQFFRYARLLKAQGAHLILAAQPALGRLLSAHRDLDELFLLGSAAEMPQADFYLPLLSAPYALRGKVSTIPAEVPYLWADADLTERWRQELVPLQGFKIGIAWQGSRTYIGDRDRSIPLASFAPLAAQSGVRLVSLQKGFGSQQLAGVDFPILDLASRLDEAAGPFLDTAAVIRNLDLVVAPDTAVAHLAGALGAPVFLAVSFLADWRWLQGRDDSPWYPTARLFRQTTWGEWTDVFERIAQAVQAKRAGPA